MNRTERGSAGLMLLLMTPYWKIIPGATALGSVKMARMPISFSDRVSIPDDVLISNLQEESVILNLDTERYFGLDSVGTRILTVLTTSESIEAAYERLLGEYDVAGQVLRDDLLALVESLAEKGLVQVSGK
jgi:hypothetical protein